MTTKKIRIKIIEFSTSTICVGDYDEQDLYRLVYDSPNWETVTEAEYELLARYLDHKKYVLIKELMQEEIANTLKDFLALAKKEQARLEKQRLEEEARKAKREEKKRLKAIQKTAKDLDALRQVAAANGFTLIKKDDG